MHNESPLSYRFVRKTNKKETRERRSADVQKLIITARIRTSGSPALIFVNKSEWMAMEATSSVVGETCP